MQTASIMVATVVMAAVVIGQTTALNSITYVVGNWQVTLTDLGVLPGGTASRAMAINNAGRVVGLATDSTFALQRPFWDANTGAITGFAENLDSAGTAVPEEINAAGETVGTVEFGGRLNKGVFWNAQGRVFALPPLAGVDPLLGSTHIRGHGINNLGQMVGAAKDGAPTFFWHAVLWLNKDTPPQDLGFLGQGAYNINYTEAYDINDFTHVVGNGSVGSLTRGFLWRVGRMIDLGALSGQVVSEAAAINNSGLIAGKSNFYPVIWRYDPSSPGSTPVIQQLPIPAGFFAAQPAAVNDQGDVVGHAGSPSIDSHAILWRDGLAVDLGTWPGGHYSVAYDINNAGQIVGTGTVTGDNLDHALMWTVVPVGGAGVNEAPSANLAANTPTPVRIGRSFSVRASFNDPDNGPWGYRLEWGDGTVTAGNASNAGTIPDISPHVYARTGTFSARLSVTDARGATGRSRTIAVRVR